jgi:hypothetical protein
MNMPEVESMDMADEHDHPTNHQLCEEGMNMVGNHRVEVKDMNTVEEHFHPMNHRPEMEGMDTVDSDMREDRITELEVVERESEGVVLARHWTSDGAARHR